MCLTLLGMDSSFKVPDNSEETAELRQELFDLAFKYLPSLRWIALGAPKCRMHLDLDVQDYAGDNAPWRWWRVTRDEDGTPVEVTEIPGWEGERIRAYLRAADATAADEFDGTSPYCFYPDDVRIHTLTLTPVSSLQSDLFHCAEPLIVTLSYDSSRSGIVEGT